MMRAAVSVAASDQILAQRLAAQAFSSGDIGHYNALMALGSQANQAEDFPAAVIAYRAALALQQEKLGVANPGTIAPMLGLALNLSDEGQYPEAAEQFHCRGTARTALQRPDGGGQAAALPGAGSAEPESPGGGVG